METSNCQQLQTSNKQQLQTGSNKPLRSKLAPLFLISALALPAMPGWCAKEPAAQAAATTVNVNTADAATLADVLDGIGASKAEAIVAHRKQHGPFKSADELADVKGIGEKWVAANRDRILLK